MSKLMNSWRASTVAALLMVALVGGCTGGCGTLAPEGVYQGDKFLYDADLVISTGYEMMHRFVKWEYDNRAALASTPEIKKAADNVRVGAPAWIASAIRLRDAYKANPNEQAKTDLLKALDLIRQGNREALGYLSKYEMTVKPQP